MSKQKSYDMYIVENVNSGKSHKYLTAGLVKIACNRAIEWVDASDLVITRTDCPNCAGIRYADLAHLNDDEIDAEFDKHSTNN